MIDLDGFWSYVQLYAIATVMGAAGGVAFELLQVRGKDTGTLEMPRRLNGGELVDLGWVASILVGAVAAVAVLYVFPPIIQFNVGGPNGADPVERYSIVKLVALSLIAGSAGRSVLTAMQGRILARVNEQKVESTRIAAEAALESVKSQAKVDAEAAARTAFSTSLRPELEELLEQAAAETPAGLARELKSLSADSEQIRDIIKTLEAPGGFKDRSRSIQVVLDRAAEEVAESVGERVDEQVEDARAVLVKASDGKGS